MQNNKTKMITKQCIECGKAFDVSIHRIESAKYCSNACKNISQTKKVAWNKGLTKEQYTKKSEVLLNKCLNCGKAVKNLYCSHSCQTSFQNKQTKGKTYTEIYGEVKAAQKRSKMSKTLSKVANTTHYTKKGASVNGLNRKGKSFEQIYGADNASKMKDSIRLSLANFRNTEEGIRQRKATSERNVRDILSGKTFANSKKGYYKGVFYGSSLEESFLKECFRILGTLQNIKRNDLVVISKSASFHKTIPDYCIVDANGDLIGLIECKWEKYMETELTYDKAVALYKYGNDNGLQSGYFTYNTLQLFKQIQGNPEPIRLNTLLSYTVEELNNYVVNRKVQRLSGEDKESNKPLKVEDRQTSTPTTHFLY